MIANKRHHYILLLLIGGRSEQSVCCSSKCVQCMCVVTDPCTHCCACHCNAYCVSAVNQKSFNPSASLGAYPLPSGVSVALFVFYFCFSLLIVYHFVYTRPILFVYLKMFVYECSHLQAVQSSSTWTFM